jgi:hypothetical protein
MVIIGLREISRSESEDKSVPEDRVLTSRYLLNLLRAAAPPLRALFPRKRFSLLALFSTIPAGALVRFSCELINLWL